MSAIKDQFKDFMVLILIGVAIISGIVGEGIAEITFDSERKCMTTIHQTEDGKIISFTKGAIDALFEKSKGFLSEGKINQDLEILNRANLRMAKDGLRVLAIGMREWNKLPDNLNPANIGVAITTYSSSVDQFCY